MPQPKTVANRRVGCAHQSHPAVPSPPHVMLLGVKMVASRNLPLLFDEPLFLQRKAISRLPVPNTCRFRSTFPRMMPPNSLITPASSKNDNLLRAKNADHQVKERHHLRKHRYPFFTHTHLLAKGDHLVAKDVHHLVKDGHHLLKGRDQFTYPYPSVG